MKSVIDSGKWMAAIAVTVLGGVPAMIQTLAALMAVDYASGLLNAWAQRKWSSDIGRRGLAKKAQTIMLLLLVRWVQQRTGFAVHLDEGGAVLYIVNELISIVENCARANVPLSPMLVNALLVMKKSEGQQASAAQIAELDAPVPEGKPE